MARVRLEDGEPQHDYDRVLKLRLGLGIWLGDMRMAGATGPVASMGTTSLTVMMAPEAPDRRRPPPCGAADPPRPLSLEPSWEEEVTATPASASHGEFALSMHHYWDGWFGQ